MAKIFVYGTLIGAVDASRPARATGVMYDIGRIPAVDFTKMGDVYGEVQVVNREVLERYDMYEGVDTGLYKRVKVLVHYTDADGGEEVVWSYGMGRVLESERSSFRRVSSGRWESRFGGGSVVWH